MPYVRLKGAPVRRVVWCQLDAISGDDGINRHRWWVCGVMVDLRGDGGSRSGGGFQEDLKREWNVGLRKILVMHVPPFRCNTPRFLISGHVS